MDCLCNVNCETIRHSIPNCDNNGLSLLELLHTSVTITVRFTYMYD